MSSIDSALTTIISQPSSISHAGTRKRRTRAKKSAGSGASVAALGKSAKTAKSKKQRSKAESAAAAAKLQIQASPVSSARRVVVSGLPLDVDENAVKEFFSSQIGRIRNVKGSYSSQGVSTGTFTINFDKPGSAQKTLEKFDNQPIDGGKTRLHVQILLEGVKPLSQRIGVASAGSTSAKTTPKKLKVAAGKPKKVAKKPVVKKKAEKKKPRTAADLDAEMNDYFASANSEISV